MNYDFYQSKEYRRKQSVLMKESWREGLFNFHYKRDKKICAREGCDQIFETIPSDPKIYCSHNCAAIINNKKRTPFSIETRFKIARSLKGIKSPFKGIIKVPRVEIVCANPLCKKVFLTERWMRRKFCSNKCVMKVVGGKADFSESCAGKSRHSKRY